MILCNVDKAGRVLTMSYSQHVGVDDMRRCLGTVRDLMENLQPGFFLLTDLSNLESMDAACAVDLGTIMDLCGAKGMSSVARVIPDPNKDIGFDLISRFHHGSPVRTQNHESMAEAIKSLLGEESPPVETLKGAAPDEMARKREDDLAESHFTVEAGKAAEVNEGGLVDPAVAS